MDIKEEKFYRDLDSLKLKYELGEIPHLTSAEMDLLRFCHDRDMIAFLREEFEKHPIILDENGGLVGDNPFKKERRQQTLSEIIADSFIPTQYK